MVWECGNKEKRPESLEGKEDQGVEWSRGKRLAREKGGLALLGRYKGISGVSGEMVMIRDKIRLK